MWMMPTRHRPELCLSTLQACVLQPLRYASVAGRIATALYLAPQSGLERPGVRNRDIIESKMTPAQVAEAQRLAREWKPK